MAYAIAAGLRNRTIAPAIGGLLAGHLFHTALVAAGVAAMLARSPLAITVLSVGGAAYLTWLGIGAVRDPGDLAAATPVPTRQAIKGFGISGLNPKVWPMRSTLGTRR